MAEVQLTRVEKRFGTTRALDGVDLDVHDGEFLCLLGPSGAGKTTLLRCIAGLETPDAGHLMIGGQDVRELAPSERNVAMVFETYALYPHLTVFENLAYPLRERRVAENRIRERVGRIAELLGVSHTLDRPPQTLSGGEMQRVAIGRAIVREARVYLFDEPLSHLDAQLRERMRAELKRIHRELGGTLIYATPDQLEALTMPDRVAVLREGKVVQCDTPETIYFEPKHAFVATYVGDPPMNLLPARMTTTRRLETEWFVVEPWPRDVSLGLCRLGVRPEDVRLQTSPSEAEGDVSFRCAVYAVEMCGDVDLVTLAIGKHRWRALSTSPRRYRSGEPIVVTFPIEKAFLIDPETEAVW